MISAPSGCGKTTLVRRLTAADAGLRRAVSVTTRPPRSGERDGRDYFFVGREEFDRRRKRDRLVEWARVFGHYYGTPREAIREREKGRDVILTIDVQGARKVKRKYPEAILIFVVPPKMEELRRRLEKRRSDTGAERAKRLAIAEKELSFLGRYDYLVVNDRLRRAVDDLRSIVRAERCRIDGIKIGRKQRGRK